MEVQGTSDQTRLQLKLLKKILNKLSGSLCPVSSNEKISNIKYDPKNWKLIWVLRFSLFFGLVLNKYIFYVLNLLLGKMYDFSFMM